MLASNIEGVNLETEVYKELVYLANHNRLDEGVKYAEIYTENAISGDWDVALDIIVDCDRFGEFCIKVYEFKYDGDGDFETEFKESVEVLAVYDENDDRDDEATAKKLQEACESLLVKYTGKTEKDF